MPERYASFTTRQKLEGPISEMKEIKSNPYLLEKIPNRDKFEKDFDKRNKILESVTPPDVQGEEKDKLHKRLSELSEALVKGNEKYVPPMPNEVQMQKSPVGAVDQHMRWEKFWKHHSLDSTGKIYRVEKGGRGAIFEWKDLRRIMCKEYEEESPNYANIEMLRPTMSTSSLADTKLPVSYGFSPEAKIHYDEVFDDHIPTDVEKKIESAEIDRLKKVIAGLEKALSPKTKKKGVNMEAYSGPRCEAINKEGAVCGRPTVKGTRHCMSKWHKVQIEEKETAAQPKENAPIVEG
jgi:hypothetical protein